MPDQEGNVAHSGGGIGFLFTNCDPYNWDTTEIFRTHAGQSELMLRGERTTGDFIGTVTYGHQKANNAPHLSFLRTCLRHQTSAKPLVLVLS